MGTLRRGFQRLSLRDVSGRGRGGDRVVAQSLVGPRVHPLAQRLEIWSGIHGSSGRRRRPQGSRAEQERHADDGGHHARVDHGSDGAALGAVEHPGAVDAAQRAGFRRPRLLRRLREDHQAERCRHHRIREAGGAVRPRDLHRSLSLAIAGHPASGDRHHGAVLQVPDPDRGRVAGNSADGVRDRRQLERGESHRRPRWAGDRIDRDRCPGVCDSDLCRRKQGVRRLPVHFVGAGRE